MSEPALGPSGADDRAKVRKIVDYSMGSHQFLTEAIRNHNAAIVDRFGRRYPKLTFQKLVRSLTGSWMRDEI